MQKTAISALVVMCFITPSSGLWAKSRTRSRAKPQVKVADEKIELIQQGIDRLMNGDPDSAISFFQQAQKQAPEWPVGYLMEADATWWKIYYRTSNLIDPDVFDVVSTYSTPYDNHFEEMVETTIAKSRAMRKKGQGKEVAAGYLYEGMAYALEGRLSGLRARDLATARAGKKMRNLLLEALQRDPSLTDAYLGLGIYNYFVDTLPTIIKLLRFLIALPGGDRQEGLKQLNDVAERGTFAKPEAKFYLAKDYTRKTEGQYSKALHLFQELSEAYPQNPLWKMLVGSVYIRMGQQQTGENYYEKALQMSAGSSSEAFKAIHEQAHHSLDRMHGR